MLEEKDENSSIVITETLQAKIPNLLEEIEEMNLKLRKSSMFQQMAQENSIKQDVEKNVNKNKLTDSQMSKNEQDFSISIKHG